MLENWLSPTQRKLQPLRCFAEPQMWAEKYVQTFADLSRGWVATQTWHGEVSQFRPGQGAVKRKSQRWTKMNQQLSIDRLFLSSFLDQICRKTYPVLSLELNLSFSACVLAVRLATATVDLWELGAFQVSPNILSWVVKFTSWWSPPHHPSLFVAKNHCKCFFGKKYVPLNHHPSIVLDPHWSSIKFCHAFGMAFHGICRSP